MHTLNGGSWASVGEGCPLRCVAAGRDEGHLHIGDGPNQYELTFDLASMRDLVAKSTAALAEMEAAAG